jgi:hypothetical protein
MKHATHWLAILTMGVTSTIAAPNTSSPVLQRPSKEDIPGLVAVLGHLDYGVRAQATKRLKLCDQTELVGPLSEAYRQATDVESRLRIREIARDVYLRQFEVGTGFLGIRMSMMTGGQQNGDDRLKPKQSAILIVAVLPDTAAERVDLRYGDLIVGINGESIPPDGRGVKFSQIISSHKAGEKVTLSLIRDRPLQMEVPLGGKSVEFWVDAAGLPDHEKIEKVEKSLRQWWQEHFEPDSPPEEKPIQLPLPSLR